MTPPLPENLWFPVAPGITELPEAPAVETATYVPGNAIPTPPGFDPNSPGDIWASLPVGQEPTYAKSLTPDALVPTYRETLKSLGLIKVRMSARRYYYSLAKAEKIAVLTTHVEVSAVRVRLLSAAGSSFIFNGQATDLSFTRRITAAVGTATTTGYSAGSVRSYGIGTNAGTFALSGQNAIVKYQRSPLAANAAAFSLSGKEALWRSGVIVLGDAGAFTLSGKAAGKLQGLIMLADARSFAATGQDAALNYISPVFSIVSYTGNATARSITGAGFQPSMVWINNLAGSLIHDLTIFDQRRGTGRFIRTIAAGQEYVDAQTLTSFDSNGFSLGTSTTTNSSGTSRFYEAFCWKGLGSANTDTSGTLTSTTQVSPAAGFSIFTYTGNSTENATVGHGLGSAPEWVFIQSRTSGFSYSAQCHSSLLSGARLWELTSNAAAASSTLYIRAVGASRLTLSSNNAVNNTIITYVGYAFTSVPGVSKLGLATGDGTGVLSINVGFCPKMLIIKTYIGTGDWLLCRRTNNTTGYVTQTSMNLSTASTVSTQIQITSTGFSIDSGGDGNVSGSTESIWYMAYA